MMLARSTVLTINLAAAMYSFIVATICLFHGRDLAFFLNLCSSAINMGLFVFNYKRKW